ncbi:NRDE-2, necessary for RNA interference-domain-containing protein [Mucor lusitanicus]|uniref:DUF1740-domain-containing protein n=2 Tax=Mucor circinelloides f. lusitanicus TaxID=29924 RepID=A0A168NGW1_MUCCL|nr:NRDE-2, necessary for RNA interference-domain-containing protein [Mucor lusitanicus]OAD06255.1 hypothetical protein MUCCIDRAFT_106823 [Mucor lusitanicus CBS 277.49]
MDSDKNKALVRGIPAPPVFDSAPNIHAGIPIPSFSSAPDFSATSHLAIKDTPSRHERSSSPDDYKPRHHHTSSSSSSTHRSSSRRHHRSRSPSHRHRSYSHHKSSSSSSSSRHRHRSRSPPSHRHRKKSPEIVHTGTLNTGLTFVMDKRGDADNLRYGGNHIYSIPEYKRRGGGRVVGLPFNKRIDNSVVKAGQVSIIDRSDKKPPRYTDSNYAWKELDKSLKRIRIKPKRNLPDPFASHTNTISFDDQFSKHALENETYASSGVDYRSLEGNKVKRRRVDEDSEEEEGESFNDHIRQRTIDFNRKLDQEPHNVQLWLDFIRFQDEVAAGLDPANSSNNNKSSLNEVKLSIFEKALDHNPTDEELIHAYLTCGAETWETLKLLREWDTMLKQHPDSIRLWAEYINLRQTNFASFSYTQCVKVFEDALSTLKRQANKCKQDDMERREDIESLMVYILLRACLFIKQSGYQEKAFAIIQAAVEFNLYAPVNFSMKHVEQQHTAQEKVDAFVEFWDSEVLRFGEAGALGWHEYFRARDNGEEIPDTVLDKPPTNNEEDDNDMLSLKDWLASELESEQKNRLPLRMNQAEDDSVDEDPYRIILSDDITSFLFDTTSEGARQSLIYSVFVFMGLPYTPPQVGTNTHFFTDTFTHNEMALSHFWPSKPSTKKHLVWYVAGVPMNPQETTSEMNPYYIPNSYPVGLNELFAKSGSWFRCAGKEYMQCNVDEAFTRTVFQQLLAVEKSQHLTICYLAFESSCGHKSGRRLAKSLLKDQTTSLILWNAYAQMEKSHDRMDEARKVYLTALSMYHTFPEHEQRNAPILYHMFAKLELENSRPQEALKILASMSSHEPYNDQTPPPTSTLILKTREYFSQKLAQLSTLSESQTERHIAINMVACCGLFEYLSSGLDSACLVYQRALDYIKERRAERGYESEMVWIDYATLLYRHATTSSSYKPGLLRHAMEQALALFPNNTIFLGFYMWNESKTKIFNRVQHLLNDAVKKDSNVILWLSAIYSELHKYTPYHVNSVRDYFERSTQDTRTRPSILLWKCYIQFELMQDNTQKARSLFYRSIRECPWSKELYMLGIKSFGADMEEKEANELISLMMEKEIRLRIPIDDEMLT